MAEQTTETPIGGITPYLSLNGVGKALEFYAKALGAETLDTKPAQTGDGRFMHAVARINGGLVFMSDAFPEYGYDYVPAQGFNLHLQVDDAEFWYNRAVEAGCTVTMPLKVEFWGDTYGQFKDPFGITWAVGSKA